jgi:hypothetical protein
MQQADEEGDAWVTELVAAMRAGIDAESVRAAEPAEAHRQFAPSLVFRLRFARARGIDGNYVRDPEQLAFLVRPGWASSSPRQRAPTR